jgi:hypothetical protein
VTARSLPPNADLRHLRNQAKALSRGFRQGKTDVCDTLRLLPRFAGKPDQEIVGARVPLQEMQHALAMVYGFRNWAALRKHVLTAGAAGDERAVGRVVLRDTVEQFKRAAEGVQEPHLYMVTQVACMRSAGWTDVDYDTLMAVSGASLLFGYHPQDVAPAYAFEWIGIDDRIAEITGFATEWITFEDDDHAWQRVRETIDSGLVAMAHCEGYFIIFFGYEDAPKREGRRVAVVGEPFHGPPGVWFDWDKFVWWAGQRDAAGKIARLRQETASASAGDVARAVLRDAVAWSAQPPSAVAERVPEATFGLAGMHAYADAIADVAGKPARYFSSPWRGCYPVVLQWHARRSTVAYLRRLAGADLFPQEANAHVRAASDGYRSACAAWEEFDRQLGRANTDDEPWDLKENRFAGAAAVRQASEHEGAAIEELVEALAVIADE